MKSDTHVVSSLPTTNRTAPMHTALKVIRAVVFTVKLITAPFWFTAWIGWKVFLFLLPLFLAAMISGCASSSSHFDKSPCACDFRPLNQGKPVTDAYA